MGLFKNQKNEMDFNSQPLTSFNEEEPKASYRELPLRIAQFSIQNELLVLIAIYEENGKACKLTYQFDQDDDDDDISYMVEFTDSPQGKVVIKCVGQDEEYDKVIIPRNMMFKAE